MTSYKIEINEITSDFFSSSVFADKISLLEYFDAFGASFGASLTIKIKIHNSIKTPFLFSSEHPYTDGVIKNSHEVLLKIMSFVKFINSCVFFINQSKTISGSLNNVIPSSLKITYTESYHRVLKIPTLD